MNWMIIATSKLKRGEERVRLRAGGAQEPLADFEILEVALFGDFVSAPGAGFGLAHQYRVSL
jgi:hypothetical protein